MKRISLGSRPKAEKRKGRKQTNLVRVVLVVGEGRSERSSGLDEGDPRTRRDQRRRIRASESPPTAADENKAEGGLTDPP